MASYTGDASKVISSSYLYQVIQNLKTKYIDTLTSKTSTNETNITNLTTRVDSLETESVVFEDTDLDLDSLT